MSVSAFPTGSGFVVHIPESDVRDWAAAWPCFGDRRRMWFEFARNGDLIDMSDDGGMDGAGVLALSHDAEITGALNIAFGNIPTREERRPFYAYAWPQDIGL